MPHKWRVEIASIFKDFWNFESNCPPFRLSLRCVLLSCCRRTRRDRWARRDSRVKVSPKILRDRWKLLLEKLHQVAQEAEEQGRGTFEVTRQAGRGVVLTFGNLAGQQTTLHDIDPHITVGQLKERLQWASAWAPEYREQRLIWQEQVLSDDTQTISKLGISMGTTLGLVRIPYCDLCRQAPCKCTLCHGEGSWQGNLICTQCGKQNMGCPECLGQCRCATCHGCPDWGNCRTCGRRGVCWAGYTYVLLPGGATKKVRDCCVGTEVLTVKGSRRIARIWDSISRADADTEVCYLDGIWLTSHHPVISGNRWVFPADLVPSFLWRNVRDLVPDLYNFELQGHDDTILLWGGDSWPLVVSCTIGKFLGPSFGYTYATRRSTRCGSRCAQCDAVYVEGLDFGRIPSAMRWTKFPAFPQVEWDGAVESEFDLAVARKAQFAPPEHRMALLKLSGMGAPPGHDAKSAASSATVAAAAAAMRILGAESSACGPQSPTCVA